MLAVMSLCLKAKIPEDLSLLLATTKVTGDSLDEYLKDILKIKKNF